MAFTGPGDPITVFAGCPVCGWLLHTLVAYSRYGPLVECESCHRRHIPARGAWEARVKAEPA